MRYDSIPSDSVTHPQKIWNWETQGKSPKGSTDGYCDTLVVRLCENLSCPPDLPTLKYHTDMCIEVKIKKISNRSNSPIQI